MGKLKYEFIFSINVWAIYILHSHLSSFVFRFHFLCKCWSVLSLSLLFVLKAFKKDKSSKVTRFFIVGLLSDICVRLFPEVCSSPFLYQLLTPPLTTRRLHALSIYWLFSGHTKLSLKGAIKAQSRHFWLYWCLNQALSPLKQTK